MNTYIYMRKLFQPVIFDENSCIIYIMVIQYIHIYVKYTHIRTKLPSPYVHTHYKFLSYKHVLCMSVEMSSLTIINQRKGHNSRI